MNTKRQKKFLTLYEPVHDRFERFCRARVYGQMEFRDLINDTLVIAFQKFHTLKSEKAFLSYLFGISIKILANHNRKKREVDYVADHDLGHISSDNCHDRDAEIDMLYKAMACLPEDQQESVLLFEITGFSIKEISELHQVSEATVRQRLVRGRKKLAQILAYNSATELNKDEIA